MKEINERIREFLDEGYTVEQILNGLWSVADEVRINYSEKPETYRNQSDRNELSYYEKLSTILWSSYAQVRDLK